MPLRQHDAHVTHELAEATRVRHDGHVTLPSLGLISHGTSSPAGQAAIRAFAAAIAADLREIGAIGQVMLGHVDVQHPDVAEVLAALPADRPVILAPLLLSPGYHVHVDLAEAVAESESHPEFAGRQVLLSGTIGPDPRLAHALAERLPPLSEDDQLVLLAAGSSDERANEASQAVAESLSDYLGRPVITGFHAGAHPRLTEIVEQKSPADGRTIYSSYLLAPGYFQDLAEKATADSMDLVAPPLLTEDTEPSQTLVGIVRDRVVSALKSLSD